MTPELFNRLFSRYVSSTPFNNESIIRTMTTDNANSSPTRLTIELHDFDAVRESILGALSEGLNSMAQSVFSAFQFPRESQENNVFNERMRRATMLRQEELANARYQRAREVDAEWNALQRERGIIRRDFAYNMTDEERLILLAEPRPTSSDNSYSLETTRSEYEAQRRQFETWREERCNNSPSVERNSQYEYDYRGTRMHREPESPYVHYQHGDSRDLSMGVSWQLLRGSGQDVVRLEIVVDSFRVGYWELLVEDIVHNDPTWMGESLATQLGIAAWRCVQANRMGGWLLEGRICGVFEIAPNQGRRTPAPIEWSFSSSPPDLPNGYLAKLKASLEDARSEQGFCEVLKQYQNNPLNPITKPGVRRALKEKV